MRKTILSLLLGLTLVCTMLPTKVFAGFCRHPHQVGIDRYGCTTVLQCTECGQTFTDTNHNYGSYGDWSNYDATCHRRSASCSNCYDTVYQTEQHTLTTTYKDAFEGEHLVRQRCTVCKSTVSETYEAHADADSDGHCDLCDATMSFFSVTVPASLQIVMDENGTCSATEASIANNSSDSVVVSSVTVNAVNGWTLVPFGTNMAREYVDSKLIGFSILGAATTQTGTSETLQIGRKIGAAELYAVTCDAVVSATSQPIDEQGLELVFIVEWS